MGVRRMFDALLPLGLFARQHPAPVIVLGYHGLVAEDRTADWMRVPVGRFLKHLDLLQELGRVVGPEEIDEEPVEVPGEPRLRFLLTFDDGFADNHEFVLPILRARRLPAMFFVSTAHLESGRPFWFDRVITPLLLGKCEVADLRPFGLARYRVGGAPPPWKRVQRVLTALKALESRRPGAFDDALAWFDRMLSPSERMRLPRPLRDTELREMARSGWCAIGSHAHEHRILTRLPRAERLADLRRSREVLRRVSGRSPTAIAYPNGDWDAQVLADCRESGFELGFTAEEPVWPDTPDPLLMPRLLVGGFDRARHLRGAVARAVIAAGRRRPAPAETAESTREERRGKSVPS